MFALLPPELKSLAVRARVQYSPHPYVWMTPAKAHSTGLGIVSEGKRSHGSNCHPLKKPKSKFIPWFVSVLFFTIEIKLSRTVGCMTLVLEESGDGSLASSSSPLRGAIHCAFHLSSTRKSPTHSPISSSSSHYPQVSLRHPKLSTRKVHI